MNHSRRWLHIFIVLLGRICNSSILFRNSYSDIAAEIDVITIFSADWGLHVSSGDERIFHFAGVEDSLLGPPEMLIDAMVFLFLMLVPKNASSDIAGRSSAVFGADLPGFRYIMEVELQTIDTHALRCVE